MTILCYGEALIDLLGDKNNHKQFCAQSGGAPANVAVGIAKLGENSVFLGGFGNDLFSRRLKQDLADFGVEVIAADTDRNTALAIISLDENGERSFAFHRHNTADLMLNQQAIDSAIALAPQVVHYCSNTLTTEDSRYWHGQVIQSLPGYKSYDVNLRLNLWESESQAIIAAKEALSTADLVKLSDEEQLALALTDDDLLAMSSDKTILLTAGKAPIHIFYQGQQASVEPPVVTPVDTTAGGDGFISGVLAWIAANQWPESIVQWQQAVQQGAQVGAKTVTRYGSFDALPGLGEL
ncbi:carbohydrate kinase family protein [Salinibius halmophilus]|uniref:carbohydrate kinase family protein n=1 Tax=Salinibius halmophilus TaxID=1853216 RepID=UPI000E668C89|nr:carbohydrate kinase [Salinibius halmophilus]